MALSTRTVMWPRQRVVSAAPTFRPKEFSVWTCVRGSHGGGRCGDVVVTRPLADRSLAFVVADFVGNGPQRALRAEAFAYRLLTRLASGDSPALALRGADAALQRGGPEDDLPPLMSVFAGIADRRKQRVQYVSAAHEAAMILGSDGTHRHLACTGPLAGVFEAARFGDAQVRFAPGDTLVVATDGISEGRRPDGAFFGTAGIVHTAVHALRRGDDPAAELVAEAVRHGARGRRDASALVVRS